VQHVDLDAAGGPSAGAAQERAELRALILAQTRAGLGVPVLLRTAAPGADEADPFGTAAYRRQVALAARLMEGADLTGLADLERESPGPPLLERPLLALNFHHVAPADRDVVRRQLARAAALGPTFDLDADPVVGEVRVLVGFYDGFADTAAFAAQECHDLGLRALFFPLTSAPHGARLVDDRALAELARVHEVCWHTASHASAAEVGADRVQAEVVGPFRWIEAVTGRAPRVGAWRGGTRLDATLPGDAALLGLGLTHVVSNWSLERVGPPPGPGVPGTGPG